jgi:hypothetical protein
VVFNGVIVNDVDLDEAARSPADGKEHPGLRRAPFSKGLQLKKEPAKKAGSFVVVLQHF